MHNNGSSYFRPKAKDVIPFAHWFWLMRMEVRRKYEQPHSFRFFRQCLTASVAFAHVLIKNWTATLVISVALATAGLYQPSYTILSLCVGVSATPWRCCLACCGCVGSRRLGYLIRYGVSSANGCGWQSRQHLAACRVPEW